MSDLNRYKEAADKLERSSPAGWVEEMREHFIRTGAYRPRDIRRLVGDQTEGVKFGPGAIREMLKFAKTGR